MKYVITTQYMENYGSHSWDGQGLCPQYWKAKGGFTYIFENVTPSEAMDKSRWDKVDELVGYRTDYDEEYIIESVLLDDDADLSEFYSDWERPAYCVFDGVAIIAQRITPNDEYGYMKEEVKAKVETWLITESDKSASYKCIFQLNDGSIVDWQGRPVAA